MSEMATLPFERALAELEEIVTKLERGSVPLEESITIYERGEALKKHCEALLRNAELRVSTSSKSNGGLPGARRPARASMAALRPGLQKAQAAAILLAISKLINRIMACFRGWRLCKASRRVATGHRT